MPVAAGDLAAALVAAQHGDQQSFRLLYRAVQPLLLRYLWEPSRFLAMVSWASNS